MGCDIHIMAEVKRNGKWEKNVKEVFGNPYYNKDDSESGPKLVNTPSNGRSYDWFSVLADVRNGYGFAGVRTGSGFDVISEPKGVPLDASPEWLEEVQQWSGDMHSQSWLTVDELESFNWDQTSDKEGVITLKQYGELRSTPNACPVSWSGWISGRDILVVNTNTADIILDHDSNIQIPMDGFDDRHKVHDASNIESILDSIVSGGVPASKFNISVNYKWQVSYHDWFSWQIKNIIEPLRELANEFEDARIVFGFDN